MALNRSSCSQCSPGASMNSAVMPSAKENSQANAELGPSGGRRSPPCLVSDVALHAHKTLPIAL